MNPTSRLVYNVVWSNMLELLLPTELYLFYFLLCPCPCALSNWRSVFWYSASSAWLRFACLPQISTVLIWCNCSCRQWDSKKCVHTNWTHATPTDRTTFVIVKRIKHSQNIYLSQQQTHIHSHPTHTYEHTLAYTYLEQYADAEIHKRLREVNHTFPCIVDGHRGNS